jgi:acyl dehydratase
MMELSVGSAIPEFALPSVSADRMKLLAAILRDPNPIHWDRAEVAKRGLGNRVINQGPTNLGYITNMLMAWAGPDCLRHLEARFTSNVFEGDSVVAGGVVSAVRRENGEQLVDCEVWLDRHGDDDAEVTRAVSGSATVAIRGG